MQISTLNSHRDRKSKLLDGASIAFTRLTNNEESSQHCDFRPSGLNQLHHERGAVGRLAGIASEPPPLMLKDRGPKYAHHLAVFDLLLHAFVVRRGQQTTENSGTRFGYLKCAAQTKRR